MPAYFEISFIILPTTLSIRWSTLPRQTWPDQIETQWRIYCSPDTQLVSCNCVWVLASAKMRACQNNTYLTKYVGSKYYWLLLLFTKEAYLGFYTCQEELISYVHNTVRDKRTKSW